MRPRLIPFVLPLGALFACAVVTDRSPGPTPPQATTPAPTPIAGSPATANPDPDPDPTPTPTPNPMAHFARLVGGRWKVTFTSGEVQYHGWAWGPGKHSLGKTASASDAAGSPWQGEVLYWHPGHKQVRLLSIHGDIPAVGRGVCEGTIRFEGATEVGELDLYQPRGLRKIGHRRSFAGADSYHEILLEDNGDGYEPLVEWDFFRIEDPAAPPRSAGGASKPSGRLALFEPLVGPTWEATTLGGERGGEQGAGVRSTFEWIESLQVVRARVVAPSTGAGAGEPAHLLDAYIFHHLGRDTLRCLALSHRGGVYEGEVTVLEDGTLQFDLKGYEGDRTIPLVVRLDFEKDGTVRQRAWTVEVAGRTPVLDVSHRKPPPQESAPHAR